MDEEKQPQRPELTQLNEARLTRKCAEQLAAQQRASTAYLGTACAAFQAPESRLNAARENIPSREAVGIYSCSSGMKSSSALPSHAWWCRAVLCLPLRGARVPVATALREL
jgi:hypothetical protein